MHFTESQILCRSLKTLPPPFSQSTNYYPIHRHHFSNNFPLPYDFLFPPCHSLIPPHLCPFFLSFSLYHARIWRLVFLLYPCLHLAAVSFISMLASGGWFSFISMLASGSWFSFISMLASGGWFSFISMHAPGGWFIIPIHASSGWFIYLPIFVSLPILHIHAQAIHVFLPHPLYPYYLPSLSIHRPFLRHIIPLFGYYYSITSPFPLGSNDLPSSAQISNKLIFLVIQVLINVFLSLFGFQ